MATIAAGQTCSSRALSAEMRWIALANASARIPAGYHLRW